MDTKIGQKQQWDTVLFSDETHICLEAPVSNWVQRPVGTAFDPQYTTRKVAHPKRVSIWGCFSEKGVGKICIFESMLDAKLMKEILEECLLPTASSLYPNSTWWFLQDNDPKHKSKIVTKFLFDNGIQLLYWI